MYASTERIPWKESNLALIGSDLDHKIKEAAADGETAWDSIDQNDCGLYIWRIEQFRVISVPNEQYGSFYNGDSYIILKSYKKDDGTDTIYYNIHIWIGMNSSQDEYGTAAYKMVELDEFVHGSAVQYREVQNHESSLFLSYFENQTISYQEGGVASGFTHVEEIVEVPRLYRVKGTMQKMSLSAMPSISKSNLNANDSFILYVNNRTVFVWHGTDANPSERNKSNTWSETLCTNGTVTTIEQGEEDDTFWSYFVDDGSEIPSSSDVDDDNVDEFQISLYQLQSNGATLVGSGSTSVSRSLLDSNDVFLLDSGWSIFIWIGKSSDQSEKLNAISWAHTYCTSTSPDVIRTKDLSLSMIKDGYETSAFLEYFTD